VARPRTATDSISYWGSATVAGGGPVVLAQRACRPDSFEICTIFVAWVALPSQSSSVPWWRPRHSPRILSPPRSRALALLSSTRGANRERRRLSLTSALPGSTPQATSLMLSTSRSTRWRSASLRSTHPTVSPCTAWSGRGHERVNPRFLLQATRTYSTSRAALQPGRRLVYLSKASGSPAAAPTVRRVFTPRLAGLRRRGGAWGGRSGSGARARSGRGSGQPGR
jgi:hypothetical protein